MKLFDLELDAPGLRAELDGAYRRVMDSGWVILGPELESFEVEFASYCGALHCVGVGSGLDALVLSLRAADVGSGAEVIVPSHTYAATWMAVEAVGATPVPVEVDALTYTLAPEAAAAAVTERTAALLPVSLYGHPADMDPLLALAERHGLLLLEDAAQSHGAEYKGRRIGSIAHVTAFSFYPTKNLGGLGDGGAVTTNDPALAEKLRRLRNYGSVRKNVHEIVGVNSRLDELQAAFLRVRLKRLDADNAARRERAAAYGQALAASSVQTPTEASWARHVHHLYVARTPERDLLQTKLKAQEIDTLIHYPTPCHLQPAFGHLGHRAGAFPLAERLAEEVVSLPLRPGLPLDTVGKIAQAVNAASLELAA